MSFVPFKNGRMPVGYRRKDWMLVSYAPLLEVADPDSDGTVPSLFFTAAGDEEERPPMQGEVMFFPHFAMEHCESKKPKERDVMQMQFLLRCWNYLNEQDSEKLEALEGEWDDPNWRKWQSWFDGAKAWKAKKMKEKSARRANKEKKKKEMQRAGIPDDEIDRTLESDDDSGVEVEGREVHMHSRRKPIMGPPRKKPNANGNNDFFNPNKRRRNDSPRSQASERYNSEDFQMSGGLPNDSAPRRASRGGSTFDRLINGSRNVSLDYDPAPPSQPGFFGSTTPHHSTSSNLFITRDATVDSASNIDRMARLSGRTAEDIRNMRNGNSDDGDDEDDNGFDSAETAQALRASLQPEVRTQHNIPGYNGGVSEEVAYERAVRASLQPEDRSQENIVETTEDSDGVGRVASRRDSGRGSGSRSGSGRSGA